MTDHDILARAPKDPREAADWLLQMADISHMAGLHRMKLRLRALAAWLRDRADLDRALEDEHQADPPPPTVTTAAARAGRSPIEDGGPMPAPPLRAKEVAKTLGIGRTIVLEDRALAYLATSPAKSLSQVRQHLGLDNPDAKRLILQLVKERKVRKVGQGRGTQYTSTAPVTTPVATTTTTAPKPERPPPTLAPSAALERRRDEAVHEALTRRDGIATVKDLGGCLVRLDLAPAGDEAAAIKNALLRLKVAGKVGRTLDTWSLVGRGLDA